jgi:hypothetical protein
LFFNELINWHFTLYLFTDEAELSEVLSRETIVTRLHELLPDLQDRYGVRRMALYGSFAHGSAMLE